VLQLLILNHEKAKKTKGGKTLKYHPLLIKWALSIYCRSQSSYEKLRQSLPLCLPSKRTLSDYKNTWKNSSGWHDAKFQKIEQDMKDKKMEFADLYGVLTVDEMTINQGICWSPTGEILGLQDWDTVPIDVEALDAYLTGDNITVQEVESTGQNTAKKVLQLLLTSLTNSYDSYFAYFTTADLHAKNLFDILMEATGRLAALGWHIVAWCGDNASTNQSCWSYTLKDGIPSCNPFTGDPLFMLQCIPHTIKTTRNAIEDSSDYLTAKRKLVRRGKMILWKHFKQVYLGDQKRSSKENPTGLRITKLTEAHVNLTTYSKMNNRLAEETIADIAVANEMKIIDEHGTEETRNFIKNMHIVSKIFSDPKPVRDCNDPRLQQLKDILVDLNNWYDEIQTLPNESNSSNAKYFLPKPTWFAWKLILQNIPDMIVFLLTACPKRYICLFRIKNLQNKLENRFNGQRQQGGTNRNPTHSTYGYNDSALDIIGENFLVSSKSNAGPLDTINVDSQTKLVRQQTLPKVTSIAMWPLTLTDDSTVVHIPTEIPSAKRLIDLLLSDWKVTHTSTLHLFLLSLQQSANSLVMLEMLTEKLNNSIQDIYFQAIQQSKTKKSDEISEKKISTMWHQIIQSTHALSQEKTNIQWIINELKAPNETIARMLWATAVIASRKMLESSAMHKYKFFISEEEPNINQILYQIDEQEKQKIRYIGGWVIFSLHIKHKKERSLEEMQLFDKMVVNMIDKKTETGRRYREVQLNDAATHFLYKLESLLRVRYFSQIDPTCFDSALFYTINNALSIDKYLRLAWKELISNIVMEPPILEQDEVKGLQLFTEKYMRSRTKNFLLYSNLLPESKNAFRKHLQENKSQKEKTLISFNRMEELLKLSNNTLSEVLSTYEPINLFAKFKKDNLMQVLTKLGCTFKSTEQKPKLIQILYEKLSGKTVDVSQFQSIKPAKLQRKTKQHVDSTILQSSEKQYQPASIISSQLELETLNILLSDPDLCDVFDTPFQTFSKMLLA
jgi:hypothetical protein